MWYVKNKFKKIKNYYNIFSYKEYFKKQYSQLKKPSKSRKY